MAPVLYFHGFASSPASGKIGLLRPLLAPHAIELHTPDLNVPSFEQLDWEAIVGFAESEARRVQPRAIVGSSLGAVLALELARRLDEPLPLILIAPALGVADKWISRIPPGDPIVVFNYARNGNAPIHRAFFEQMARVDADLHPPRGRVSIVFGSRDESVPRDRVLHTWRMWEADAIAPGSRFIEIAGGDHSLTAHADVIAREIVDAAASS